MDTYENDNLGMEPGNTQPISEEPVEAQEPYRNSGAGRKESPFADSPYVMNHGSGGAYQSSAASGTAKKKNGSGKIWKSVLAAVLVVVLVIGSCGATAYGVNSYWKNRTDSMTDSFNHKIDDLQSQIDANANASTNVGNSVSGSPVASEGLTPSQVYAQCQRSVVAISCVNTNSSSSGSGFILSEDGYVVTNYHVIQGASRISVITYDGQEYAATVKGSDSTNDLAVLKVEAEGLKPATIGSSNDLIIGDMVVAIGNPLGDLSSTQTVGYISGKDREVNTDGTVINMLQTDAAINPGNSGGPLFNMKGEVVGITTAKYSGTTSSGASIEGIGFAIPIDDVAGMIDDIVSLGYVTGAYLGVYVKDVETSAIQNYGVPAGAHVDSVTPGSCAEKAGIQPKDIIISLDGQMIESVNGVNSLTRALRNYKAGDTASVVVYRSGSEVTLTVTFDQKPQDNSAQEPEQPQLPSSGSYEDWYDFFFGNGIG